MKVFELNFLVVCCYYIDLIYLTLYPFKNFSSLRLEKNNKRLQTRAGGCE